MFESAMILSKVNELMAELKRGNELRARQIELMDEFVENNRKLLEIAVNNDREAHDYNLQAARMIAQQSGIEEVIKCWNDAHPLSRIEIGRRPSQGGIMPAGKLS